MSFKSSLLILAVAVGSTIGLAARPSQTPTAGQPEAARASTQKPAATGIAECDKYFELADACMASNKMTPEEKKATQASVDRLRAMAPLINAGNGRATLVDRCVKSLEVAAKDDKYGCYKTSIKKQ